jgi:hypothetical protein
MSAEVFPEICANCVYFFDPGAEAVLGACRRYPPVPVFLGMQQGALVAPGGQPQAIPVIRGAFPTSARTDTCGEFKSKVFQ